MCGEFDWAKNFITTFSPCLEDDNVESIIHFSHSYIQYYQGDLEAAQHLLTADIFSLPGFEVVARGLLLKIVFDRFIKQGKDYDFLLSCLQAHEKFISRRLFSDEKKAAQLNYARFIRKMATLKFERVHLSEKDKEPLRKKLEHLNPVISKRWLTKRIDLL